VRLDHLLSKERLAALSSRVAITRQTRSGLVAPKSITGYSIGYIGHRLVPSHGLGRGLLERRSGSLARSRTLLSFEGASYPRRAPRTAELGLRTGIGGVACGLRLSPRTAGEVQAGGVARSGREP
jgi:hypothetical protein